MFTNELNVGKLRVALVEWSVGLKDNKSSTSSILDVIPWTNEMEKVCSFATFSDEIDNAIGSPFKFDSKEFCSNIEWAFNVTKEFYEWAYTRASKIYDTYDKIIKKLNDKDIVHFLPKNTIIINLNTDCSNYLHSYRIGERVGDSGFWATDLVDDHEVAFSEGISKSSFKIIQ